MRKLSASTGRILRALTVLVPSVALRIYLTVHGQPAPWCLDGLIAVSGTAYIGLDPVRFIRAFFPKPE